MNEIKKCPFCGNKPTIKRSNFTADAGINSDYATILAKYELECDKCGYKFGKEYTDMEVDEYGRVTKFADGRKKLIDKWNKRAEEPQEKKETNIEWALKKIEKGDFYFSICEIANYIKNGKPCAECDECEFQDDEDAINYLLAPHEE